MIEQIAAAMKCQDYRTAAQLVKQLLQASPQNPWAHLYLGQLHEVSGKLLAAQTTYRQLLHDATHAKIITQARQGLERVTEKLHEQRQNAIAQATADPGDTQTGVLILEPIANESRTIAAQKLAQIMQMDSYTARLQLPTRSWKLYKSGKIGELRYLGENLRDASIPCFWIKLADIEAIPVFQVNRFDSTTSQVTVYQNEPGQLISQRHTTQSLLDQSSFTFDWSEVTQRVMGQLPIFEQVVDRDVRGKLQRKTQTQDYAQFCDLHLPQRQCILRLCDHTYQFQNTQATIRLNWNNLMAFNPIPQATVCTDFIAFAQTVLHHTETLKHLNSQINLFRRTQTNWDPAFHLYSGLLFLKNNPTID